MKLYDFINLFDSPICTVVFQDVNGSVRMTTLLGLLSTETSKEYDVSMVSLLRDNLIFIQVCLPEEEE